MEFSIKIFTVPTGRQVDGLYIPIVIGMPENFYSSFHVAVFKRPSVSVDRKLTNKW